MLTVDELRADVERGTVDTVIAVDGFLSQSTRRADVFLTYRTNAQLAIREVPALRIVAGAISSRSESG